MAEYMHPTYLFLDYLMILKEKTAKEQRTICSNTSKESKPGYTFSKDSWFEPIEFPPFVTRPLLRDCLNHTQNKEEIKPDE